MMRLTAKRPAKRRRIEAPPERILPLLSGNLFDLRAPGKAGGLTEVRISEEVSPGRIGPRRQFPKGLICQDSSAGLAKSTFRVG